MAQAALVAERAPQAGAVTSAAEQGGALVVGVGVVAFGVGETVSVSEEAAWVAEATEAVATEGAVLAAGEAAARFKRLQADSRVSANALYRIPQVVSITGSRAVHPRRVGTAVHQSFSVWSEMAEAVFDALTNCV
jgi:hypothetical protein